jgi:tRNA A-37 threonylcarbamoyl transferase component Bud32
MANKIGRFEILEKIGEGAMGTVYRAHDPAIGRVVAIKTFRLDSRVSSATRDRIVREARSAGILSHPNIVTIYDVNADGETAYIAMEFVDGQGLDAVIADAAPFRPAAVLPWLDQMADALDYAHKRGVIHRDVKPANVLLTRLGQIKLADFGIAKISSAASTDGNLILGTPGYMSPEQIRGDKIDHRTDVFSLGVVIFELLTGQRPFEGDSVVTTIYKVVNEAPPAAHELVSGLPPEIDTVLNKALEKDPDNRHTSCRKLVEALRGGVERTASLSSALKSLGPESVVKPAVTANMPAAANTSNVSGTAGATSRYCDQCGTALRPSVKFCYRCGAETSPVAPAAAAAPSVVPVPTVVVPDAPAAVPVAPAPTLPAATVEVPPPDLQARPPTLDQTRPEPPPPEPTVALEPEVTVALEPDLLRTNPEVFDPADVASESQRRREANVRPTGFSQSASATSPMSAGVRSSAGTTPVGDAAPSFMSYQDANRTEVVETAPSASLVRSSRSLPPLAGYAASTGSLELPPPGAAIDTPPRRSGLRDILPVLLALAILAVPVGILGYLVGPKLVPLFIRKTATPTAPAGSSETPGEPQQPAQPTEQAPAPTAPQPETPGLFAVSVVAADTDKADNVEAATGAPDAKVARVRPGGSIAVALPPGFVLRDDGTSAPDVRVVGTSSGDVSYTILARTADGSFARIDRVKEFGSHDMNHHKIATADAFKILNTGTGDLLVDSVEVLRPVVAK